MSSVSQGTEQAVIDVLQDMALTSSMRNSTKVGDKVLKELEKVTHVHSNRVEKANFSVLRSLNLRSILVESGFISNAGEAKKLATPQYRGKIAGAIFRGVKTYFEDVQPEGSYIAWKAKNSGRPVEHIVTRGETLSGIAQRYKTSTRRLKKFNNLRRNGIRIGQRLKIPAS